jgi:predicted nucleotidyltransferase
MRQYKLERSMDKSSIIAKLREHEAELKAAGIEHLTLHGSYARGTAIREMSDVDVIAEFAPGRRLTLLDMVAIESRLADMLGIRVDLSPANGLKEPVAAKASREGVLAF